MADDLFSINEVDFLLNMSLSLLAEDFLEEQKEKEKKILLV